MEKVSTVGIDPARQLSQIHVAADNSACQSPQPNRQRIYRLMTRLGLLLRKSSECRDSRGISGSDVRDFGVALNLEPCFTLVASPESNGVTEAFVKTIKCHYVRLIQTQDAKTALKKKGTGWFEDCNENHPHSGLRLKSPCESRPETHGRLSAKTWAAPHLKRQFEAQ